MVEKSYMTLFQLRAYKAWLERTRNEERAKLRMTSPKTKDLDRSHEMAWYANEVSEIDKWIEHKEREKIFAEMEVKAKKYLGPQRAMTPGKSKPSWFRVFLNDIKFTLGIR